MHGKRVELTPEFDFDTTPEIMSSNLQGSLLVGSKQVE